ncbi:MAG: hypothetical protein NTY42_14440 [Planctomycetota bacterium]|nr:hypothetical protein [Planctomycetota bacterium]
MNETQLGNPTSDLHPLRHPSLMQSTPGMTGADVILTNDLTEVLGNAFIASETIPIPNNPGSYLRIFANDLLGILSIEQPRFRDSLVDEHNKTSQIHSAVALVKPTSTPSMDRRKNLTEQELLSLGLGSHG